MQARTHRHPEKRIVDFVCQANLGRSDGGQETWAYQFIPALLERHPDVILRIYGQRLEGKPDSRGELRAAVGKCETRLETRFFPAKRTPWPLIFSMIRQFTGWKRREERATADVTIAVGSVVELLMLLLSGPARRSFKIVWLRTIFVDQKASRIPAALRPFARWLEVRLLLRADLLIGNGDDIAAYYESRGLKVNVIKNAVDVEEWRMPPPRLGRPIEVAYVGRLAPEKGILEFLDLARRTKSSPAAADFEFHVIGALGYEQLARESAARGEIVWHGMLSREELPRLLRTVDVCVAFTFASAERGGGGTSNAMMEQLAAGRVLLAWDNVIFRQWLDETNAFLVPQGNLEGALAALRGIAADHDGALQRAAAGTAAVKQFDVAAMMSRFDALLGSALDGRGGWNP